MNKGGAAKYRGSANNYVNHYYVNLLSETAVNTYDLTGDKRGPVRNEKCCQLCHVLRRTETAQRSVGGEGGFVLLGKSGHHVGFNDAGSNTVYADT